MLTLPTEQHHCRWPCAKSRERLQVSNCTKSATILSFSRTRWSKMDSVTSIRTWINNHIDWQMWDVITYPFPNTVGCTVEIWEWVSNFIPHLIRHVNIYPGCGNTMFVKRPQATWVPNNISMYSISHQICACVFFHIINRYWFMLSIYIYICIYIDIYYIYIFVWTASLVLGALSAKKECW